MLIELPGQGSPARALCAQPCSLRDHMHGRHAPTSCVHPPHPNYPEPLQDPSGTAGREMKEEMLKKIEKWQEPPPAKTAKARAGLGGGVSLQGPRRVALCVLPRLCKANNCTSCATRARAAGAAGARRRGQEAARRQAVPKDEGAGAAAAVYPWGGLCIGGSMQASCTCGKRAARWAHVASRWRAGLVHTGAAPATPQPLRPSPPSRSGVA